MDRVEIHNDPYGVVLILGAWNYPLQSILLPLAGAIAAGNCVILKPSELTPAVEKFLIKTIPKYLDDKSYQVFKAAAENLTPTTLELSGKSPVIIDNSADINLTVRRDVNPSDKVMQEEIVGPILPIVVIKDIKEAINFVNSKEKPKALYIFTRKSKVVNLILNSTSSGGVTVNDTLMHIACEDLPFGGVGNSGMGNYHGKRSFDVFTHKKSVLNKNDWGLMEKLNCLRYPPYSEAKIRLTSIMTAKRRGFSVDFLPVLFVFILGMLFPIIVKFFLYKF
nr:fatty aldehyde dehydrogenase-like [Onthophagus taurus]